MSSAPAVAVAQDGAELAYWQRISFVRPHCFEDLKPPPARFMSGDLSSSGDELVTKIRKPYTITKQRERWTEEEHQKFLEALKLYGRAWRHIEEHIGTKTAVQIRSHAQKFFSKLEREASTGGSAGHLRDIEIPPPRPKRKPSHPYPRKAGIPATTRPSAMDEDIRPSKEALPSFSSVSSISMQADIDSDHHKVAAFTPYVRKTRPAMDAVHLQGISLGSLSSIRSQASVKLFGRTVVVPPTDRMATSKTDTLESHMEFPVGDSSEIRKSGKLSKDLSLKERLAESNISMPKNDQKHRQAFSPYIKAADKGRSNCGSPLSLDMHVLGSGICHFEGNGQSHVSQPCMNKNMQDQGSLPTTDGQCDEELDANSNIISRKQLQMQEPALQSVFPSSMPSQHMQIQGLEGSSEKKDDPFSEDKTVPAIADSNNSDHSADKAICNSAVASDTSSDSSMQNFPQYHTTLPAVSPHLGCGTTQLFAHGIGAFGMPWHFLQSAAFHHPATYPAAIAAMGWPGLMAGHQTAKILELGNSVERHNTTNSFGDANTTAVAAASAWWALHGLLPPVAIASAWWALHSLLLPGYSHPASGPVYDCAEVPIGTHIKPSTFASVKPADNIEVNESVEDHEQDQDPDATTDDEPTSEELIESASEEHYESTGQRERCSEWINESNISRYATALHVSQGKVSFSSRESSVYDAGSPISTNAPPFADEKSKRERELQNPSSSTDEGDGRRKRSREGSSSGSNTPSCGLQTSDPEMLNTSGSDLSGMELCPQKQCTAENACELTDTDSRDCGITGDCTGENVSEEFKLAEAKDIQRNLGRGKTENSTISQIIVNEKGSPKMRFKSLDKAERNQHKDRVGGDDSVKRFKSCAYDTEQWKEVSEEGRKAFQALFSYKTLPQTFSPPSSQAESKFHGGIIEKKKLKSPQTIKKLVEQEFQVSHGSVPQSEAEIDCINLALLPQKGGDTKGVQDTTAEAGGLREEIDTGKQQGVRNQEHDPRAQSERGGSSISSNLDQSMRKMVMVLHGHNDPEDHPTMFQPFYNSSKYVHSLSGFVPYKRPLLEMVSDIKNNVVSSRQNISKGLANGNGSNSIS